MQTECPHCNTVYRISEAELSQADGQVRCGHCLAVFTADNPYSTKTYEDIIDETEADIEQDDDSPIVADVIPPELRAESRRGKKRFAFLGTLTLTVLILASIFTGVLQYAYYNRDDLVKIPELRPWLEKACVIVNCTLPDPRDTSLIVLSSKNIFTHPNAKDALMISATIINQANFEQDYPVIELRFENVRGKTIAGRRFSAEEYLAIPTSQISKMQPDTPVSFNLEIRDPGNDMVSYEFAFL